MQGSTAIQILSFGAVTYVFYRLASAFDTSRRNAAKAQALKCQEPPFEPYRWPFAIDNLLRALAADRAQHFPEDMIKRFEDLDTYTYRYRVLCALTPSPGGIF